ncbi:hypothetical protein GWI33_000751 [Rhynchophorus ferrugineus]|uniref:Uncharacterized protein n=1 Tax=Rhynchophorus ferrugineus TaxID=354439 RepID=A0A834LXQ0_RHYFE|nr:hypothetical protein GWI33_000751 [Rhynchophorus ferrugineus]
MAEWKTRLPLISTQFSNNFPHQRTGRLNAISRPLKSTAKLGKNKLYESGYPMFGRGSLGRGNSAIQLRRVETLKDRYADVFYGRPDKSWSSARSRGPEKLERLEWPR